MMLGRTAEQAAIDGLLRSARERRSGALLLTGEPGIGKSTLLAHAARQAAGQRLAVLRARGYESESAISFAGLADLLGPVLPLLDTLPAPQARALAGALSLGPPEPGGQFPVCAATLGLLAAAAEESPLLVVVDDVHWLDASSREAVLFAARRLRAEGIGLLLASRPVPERDGEYAGIRALALSALSFADAAGIFDGLAPAATAMTRRRIYDDAAGNPLGIRELCRADERYGPPSGAPALPPDARLTRAIGQRLADLPDDTRSALLLVAVAEGTAADLVLRAVRHAGLGLAALAPAEEAGLVTVGETRIRFRHPLMRSALYGAASAHARARAHACLAEVLAGEPGPAAADARAWHLAAARLPPDEETARLLDATGLRARRRGGYEEAARALEQAARFCAGQERAVRLLRAARSWQLAGRTGRVGALLAQARPLAEDPQLAGRIRHVDAFVRMWRQPPVAGLAGLTEAAGDVARTDPRRAALMYADAAVACFMLGRIAEALRLTRTAHELSRGGRSVDRTVTGVALAGALALTGHRAEATAELAAVRPALDAADPLAQAQEYGHAAYICLWLDDDEQAAHWLDRLTRRAREAGTFGVLPQALAVAAELAFRRGRWAESVAFAHESVTLAVQSRQASLYSRHFVARMHGVQGRIAECLGEIDLITTTARRLGVACMAPFTDHSLGLVALAGGDAPAAIRALERVRDHPMVRETANPSVLPWAYDLAEAYARAGRARDAQDLLRAAGPLPGDAAPAWQHAVAERCRGLLATREEVDVRFAAALGWHERSGMPFERARTLLCLGERLRRGRQRAAARTPLRQAVDVFDRLGATAWASRTRQELTASGEAEARLTGTVVGATAGLTPQELQVAMTVARGATNSEAAAALFLSRKTVEYHLSNVYRKTRLQSRAELATLLAPAS